MSLENVQLNSLEIISGDCFSDCMGLSNLNPSSVKEIRGDNVFRNCINLNTLILTGLEFVNSHFDNIFFLCDNLEHIYFGNMPPNRFSSEISFKDVEIHVPSYDSWKNYIPQSEKISQNHYKWYDYEFSYPPDPPSNTPEPTSNPPNQHSKILTVIIIVAIIVIIITIISVILLTKKSRKEELLSSQSLLTKTE